MNVSVSTAPSQKCADCPIRYRAVCSTCETDELAVLEDIKYYRNFDAGSQIMFAGDDMHFVASVVSGAASLTRTLSDGRIQMVGLLLPSDFLGRPGRSQVDYDVVAVQPVTLCCFRRKPFERLIEQTPHIGQRLLAMTLDELDVARHWMLLLGRKTAREKIASLIALIGRRTAALQLAKDPASARFDMPITREAMANYLGLTIETVSRQITALRKSGVIRLDGARHVIIPNLDRLIAETGDEAEDLALH